LEPAELTIPPQMKFIFLCYTNRSGSNHIAELLSSDGKIPLAGENLNSDTVLNLSKQKNCATFQDYFSFLMRHTSRNGIFTLKVAPAHLDLLGRTGIFDQLIDRSHFVLIERADKLGQAISHLIAFQTRRFTSAQEGDPQSQPVFNRESLERIIDGIAEDYKLFSQFFGHNGIVPIHLVYEQVVQFPIRSVAYAAAGLNMPGLQAKLENLKLTRQAGPLNEEWRRLFLNNARVA
jgi:trehalose 2-sulfotransferase